MPNLFDNLTDETQLAPALQGAFDEFDHVDIATGYLDLRGWSVLVDQIDLQLAERAKLPVARVLVGMVARSDAQQLLADLQVEVRPPLYGGDVHDFQKAQHQRDYLVEHLRIQLSRGLGSAVGKDTLQKLRRQLADGVVEMKVFTAQPLHGKTYIFTSSARTIGSKYSYVGSSNLTGAGLHSNLELNIDVEEGDANRKLSAWFSTHWDDPFALSIDEQVIDLIEESWAAEQLPTPFEIYLKVCHTLSLDARAGPGYVLPPQIENTLLDYQTDAVRTLARRIVRRGGTMLGDVVGLGKTLTAIGTAAMLETAEDYTTLVLCPKSLEQMWITELERFDVAATVVPYSMVHKELPALKRYHLVICDESHNLRNNSTRAYEAIYRYIREKDAKVLLLTATPYNLAFADVANQLGLYIDEDVDLGIVPAAAMRLDPGLSAKVDGKVNTLVGFRRSEEAEDWKRLMSEHLVRRTRSFIMRSARTDPTVLDADGNPRAYMQFPDGERFYFPNRVARPLTHDFDADDPARHMEHDDTLNAVRNLHLARYRLSEYDDSTADHTEEDRAALAGIRSGRGNVSGFVRVGLFKRLSSSGHAFVVSLQRQRERNELLLYCIDNGLPFPLGSITTGHGTGLDDDPEVNSQLDRAASYGERYELLRRNLPSNTRWVTASVFTQQLRTHLDEDNATISSLLATFGEWSAERDSKLRALLTLLNGDHAGEKVLVFTEYSDTAEYIAAGLRAAGVENVGLATGSTPDSAAVARRFAPRANRPLDQPDGWLPADEINVLVATDVLSEGQNLQDSHVVVNYDLPWAIVRVIQRAGRVDRVGQMSDTVHIYLISHENIEREINLRQRIRQRLGDAAQAFGSDERFFGSEREIKILGDLYNGQTDERLTEEDDEADAVSEAFLAWSKALEEHPEACTRVLNLPDLVHTSRKARLHEVGDAVVCFVRTASGSDAFAAVSSMDRHGALLTPTEALSVFRATPDVPTAAVDDDFYERQRDLLYGPLADDVLQSGNLKGIRKWVWERLSGNLLVGATAHPALEALHERPLTEAAAHQLKRARRNRFSDEDLTDLLVELHSAGRLVIAESNPDEVRVVCSLGVNKR